MDFRIGTADKKIYGIAANLTVLDIILVRDGCIHKDGNRLPAIGALKEIFRHPDLKFHIEEFPAHLQ
jgi:hypothetical protein